MEGVIKAVIVIAVFGAITAYSYWQALKRIRTWDKEYQEHYKGHDDKPCL